MAKFEDKQGREWVVEVTYDKVKAARNHGIDVIKVSDASLDQHALVLMDDPIWLSDALFAMCEPTINELKLDRNRFCSAVLAVRKQARRALMEAVADFFQQCEMEAECELVCKTLAATSEIEATNLKRVQAMNVNAG